MLDLAIRGGVIVTPEGVLDADIGIAAGRFVSVGIVGPAREEVSAVGLLVLPGGVDAHTHIDHVWRGPHGEEVRSPDNYFSGTVAAAFGGVTTIVDYCTQGRGQSLREAVESKRREAQGQAVIDYAFHLIPTDFSESGLAEIGEMVGHGYPSLKVFMHRLDDSQMLRTMRAVSRAGGLTMMHCENAAIDADARASRSIDGRTPARLYAETKPVASELEGTRRAISFCEYTRAPVCLVHVSSSPAIAAIREAKAALLPLWAETRPCYMLLSSQRYEEPSPRHLMYTGYPPLRDQESVADLWLAVRDRAIDMVASDHVGYTIAQKQLGEEDVTKLPQGVPSLETQLGALYSEGVGAGRISVSRLVDLVSATPARLLGLYPRKGLIAPGSDADLVLLDPTKRKTVAVSDMHGGSDFEPLEGMSFVGWPVVTISRGEVIVRGGEFVGTRGRGQLLERSTFSVETASEGSD